MDSAPGSFRVKFSSKFWEFWYQIDEIGPIFVPILENFENITYMFIPVFALNKGSLLYQEADFVTHFSGTSPDRPLNKEPPPRGPGPGG